MWADPDLAETYEAGQTLLLGPGRSEVTVAGFLDDSATPSLGGLWASLDTWRAVLAESRPGSAMGEETVQGLVVVLEDEAAAADVAAAIDGAYPPRTLTIDDAVLAIPGVEAQTSTFGQLIGVTLALARVGVALFFALLTVERLSLYAVLKAMGAKTRTIFAGVVVQALAVTLIAAAIGVAMTIGAGSPFPPAPSLRGGAGRLAISVGFMRWPRWSQRCSRCAGSRGSTPPKPLEAMMSKDGFALQMQGVRKVYPMADQEVVALDGIEMDVAEDEIVALVGPRVPARRRSVRSRWHPHPDDGRVRVGGEDITDYSAKKLTEFRRTRWVRVPGREPGPVPDRPGEPAGGGRARPHGPFPVRRAQAGGPAARGARSRRSGQQPARPALGRPEAARGHRPGSDELPGTRHVRRAHLRAGLQTG